MNSVRSAIVEFTGAHRTSVLAEMAGIEGPLGVEGFIDGNQVIGLYEGAQKIAFAMGNGTTGYLSSDGAFSYEKSGAPDQRIARLVPADPPVPDGERTAEMIKREIRDLFVLANTVALVNWCDPDPI